MLKIANDIIYNHPLKKGHRFPMIKYKLLPEYLVREGICSFSNFFVKDYCNSYQQFRDRLSDEICCDILIFSSLKIRNQYFNSYQRL